MGTRTQQLVDLVTTLMGQHGLTEKGWVFVLDNSVSRAGCCFHHTKTVSMSKHLSHSKEHGMDEVRNILLHEIAHALAGPGAKHGVEWKEIALRIGCDGHRCHNLELKPHSQVLACVLCGFVNGVRHRVCRNYWRKATCARCGVLGSVTVVSRNTWETILKFAPPTTPPLR